MKTKLTSAIISSIITLVMWCLVLAGIVSLFNGDTPPDCLLVTGIMGLIVAGTVGLALSLWFWLSIKTCHKRIIAPVYVPPVPPPIPTTACYHCVSGNALLRTRNGNLSLWECPSCGGWTRIERNNTTFWGIGLGL